MRVNVPRIWQDAIVASLTNAWLAASRFQHHKESELIFSLGRCAPSSALYLQIKSVGRWMHILICFQVVLHFDGPSTKGLHYLSNPLQSSLSFSNVHKYSGWSLKSSFGILVRLIPGWNLSTTKKYLHVLAHQGNLNRYLELQSNSRPVSGPSWTIVLGITYTSQRI